MGTSFEDIIIEPPLKVDDDNFLGDNIYKCRINLDNKPFVINNITKANICDNNNDKFVYLNVNKDTAIYFYTIYNKIIDKLHENSVNWFEDELNRDEIEESLISPIKVNLQKELYFIKVKQDDNFYCEDICNNVITPELNNIYIKPIIHFSSIIVTSSNFYMDLILTRCYVLGDNIKEYKVEENNVEENDVEEDSEENDVKENNVEENDVEENDIEENDVEENNDNIKNGKYLEKNIVENSILEEVDIEKDIEEDEHEKEVDSLTDNVLELRIDDNDNRKEDNENDLNIEENSYDIDDTSDDEMDDDEQEDENDYMEVLNIKIKEQIVNFLNKILISKKIKYDIENDLYDSEVLIGSNNI